MTYVLDTHALVWFLEANPRLTEKARLAMASPDAEIVIPAIVLAEIAYLFGRRRIGTDIATVLTHADLSENCTIYPLDEAVVQRLPVQLNIHDGLVVATALVFRDVLGKASAVITKDREIAQSSILETVW